MLIRRIAIALLISTPFAGCAVSPDAETSDQVTQDETRTRLGKADALGSCEVDGKSYCGGKSDQECWCDAKCAEYGDCCADVQDSCDIDPNDDADECKVGSDDCGPGAECAPGICKMFCPGDLNDCCAPNQCVPTDTCAAQGGICLSSPIDVTFPAKCEADFDMVTASGTCGAVNQTCCIEKTVDIIECGGFAGLQCPDGLACVDYPDDDCDPNNGGADCGGMCVKPEAPTASCVDQCGGAVGNKLCWCDDKCAEYGDCCDDYEAICSE